VCESNASDQGLMVGLSGECDEQTGSIIAGNSRNRWTGWTIIQL